MLRECSWNGKQLEPRDWCKYITRLITPFHEMNPPGLRALGRPDRWGYGALWWVGMRPCGRGTSMAAPSKELTVRWGLAGNTSPCFLGPT